MLSFETLVNSNRTAKQSLEHPWAFDWKSLDKFPLLAVKMAK